MDDTRKCKHVFPLWSSKRVIDRMHWHATIITILSVKRYYTQNLDKKIFVKSEDYKKSISYKINKYIIVQ